jgi:hypothetical protein
VVAAGQFGPGGEDSPDPYFSYNLWAVRRDAGVYDLTSRAFDSMRQLVVRGTVVTDEKSPPCLLEVMPSRPGVAVRITAITGEPRDMPFMIVVSRFPDVLPTPTTP